MRSLLLLVVVLASSSVAAQPVLVQDLVPGPGGSLVTPPWPIVVGDRMYFWATDGTHGVELWTTDGPTAWMLPEINPGLGDYWIASTLYFGAVGDTLYFNTRRPPLSQWIVELWATDGTSTWRVSQETTQDPWNTGRLGDRIYTSHVDDRGRELWYIDADGLHFAADIRPGPESSHPRGFARLGDYLLFAADDGLHGAEVWALEGDSLRMLGDIWPGPESGSHGLTGADALGGWLYFVGTDSLHGQEVWRTDGEHIERVSNFPGTVKLGLWEEVAGSLVIQVWTSGQDGQFWLFDGTELRPAATPNPSFTSASELEVYRDGFLFIGGNDERENQLWAWEGGSFREVYNRFPEGDGSRISGLTLFDDRVFFSGRDSLDNFEPWVTDGHTASEFAEIRPGVAGSKPNGLSVLNDRLLFFADDGTHGPALWAIDRVATAVGDGGATAAGLRLVYPNPVVSGLGVDYALDVPQALTAEMYDVLGRRALTVDVGARAVGLHRLRLDVSGLAPGAYVLRLRGSAGFEAARRVTVAR